MEEKDLNMRDITLEELLEAGCHFGHQVNRRNPKADEFIFEARNGVHIIDLEKTREGLISAANFLRDLAGSGGSLLMIGTKRQAKGILREEIDRAKQAGAKSLFYVISHWVGGTLTNLEEVGKNFKKLKDLREFLLDERKKEGYTKREIVLFEKEKNKLENLYEGIEDLDKLPDAIFAIDIHNENIAVSEGTRKEITTIGIVDTNSDPSSVDYAIPANDDAVGSIKAISSFLIDAWLEGQKQAKEKVAEEIAIVSEKEKATAQKEEKSAKVTKTVEKEAAKKEKKESK